MATLQLQSVKNDLKLHISHDIVRYVYKS